MSNRKSFSSTESQRPCSVTKCLMFAFFMKFSEFISIYVYQIRGNDWRKFRKVIIPKKKKKISWFYTLRKNVGCLRTKKLLQTKNESVKSFSFFIVIFRSARAAILKKVRSLWVFSYYRYLSLFLLLDRRRLYGKQSQNKKNENSEWRASFFRLFLFQPHKIISFQLNGITKMQFHTVFSIRKLYTYFILYITRRNV